MTLLIKPLLYVALATALILLVPFVAMQFNQDVDWSAADFVIMGALLFSTGLAYVLLTTQRGNAAYRLAVAAALGTGLLLTWVNLAVGFIGGGPTPANLLCGAVPIIAAIGTIAGRFRPASMARAMFAAAVTQAAVPMLALLTAQPGSSLKPVEIVATGIFAAGWVVAALLFRRADTDGATTQLEA